MATPMESRKSMFVDDGVRSEKSDASTTSELAATSMPVEPPFHTIDYVIVYEAENTSPRAISLREGFMKLVADAGLKAEKQKIDAFVFVKIFCPFERLASEAEFVNLQMDLKGCEVSDDGSRCQWLNSIIERFFATDDQVDFVSGPFEKSKLHLYEGSDDLVTFFRGSVRSLLVHHILINLDLKTLPELHHFAENDSKNKLGLPDLLIQNVYKDSFVLHDESVDDPYYKHFKIQHPAEYQAILSKLKSRADPRKDLNETWTRFWKFQPLWKIRDYFGEKIALYFAWEGTFVTLLWPPAFFGFAIFCYGLQQSASRKRNEICNCINGTDSTNATNSSLLLSSIGAAQTVCFTKSLLSVVSKNVLEVVSEAFNNELNPYFALFVCIWGALFIEKWKRTNAVLAYKWDVSNFEDNEPDKPEFYGTEKKLDPITKEPIWVYPESRQALKFLCSAVVIIGMMIFVFLSIAGTIVFRMVMRVHYKCPKDGVDDDDNDCTDQNVEHATLCVLLGTLAPALLGALFVLIWNRVYYIVAAKLNDWENHQTLSAYNDALILKLFVFNFVNSYSHLFYIILFRPTDVNAQQDGLFGLGPTYQDTCKGASCMSLLSLQVLILMLTKPMEKLFTDIVIPWSQMAIEKSTKLFRSRIKRTSIKISNTAEPVVVPPNVNPERHFVYREWKKPPTGDFTLEEYNEKVVMFGYLVMFSTAFPLAPVIALISNFIDTRVDARRLLWFNRRPIAFIASDIGMWASILHFVNFAGIITNAYMVGRLSSFGLGRQDVYQLVIMIGFEHIVFVLEYIIDLIIPDVPQRIRQARRREKLEVYKILNGELHLAESSPRAKRNPRRSISSGANSQLAPFGDLHHYSSSSTIAVEQANVEASFSASSTPNANERNLPVYT